MDLVSSSGIAFNPGIPIYQQIIAEIKHRIVSGELDAGARLESVRDLALSFEVNPNTMQRALSQLEQEGLLHTERTSGRYITQDRGLIAKMRTEEAKNIIEQFLTQMSKIGFSEAEITQLLTSEMKQITEKEGLTHGS